MYCMQDVQIHLIFAWCGEIIWDWILEDCLHSKFGSSSFKFLVVYLKTVNTWYDSLGLLCTGFGIPWLYCPGWLLPIVTAHSIDLLPSADIWWMIENFYFGCSMACQQVYNFKKTGTILYTVRTSNLCTVLSITHLSLRYVLVTEGHLCECCFV